MVQGPNQDKYGQKGTRAGKMEDRKEGREREGKWNKGRMQNVEKGTIIVIPL
jgi:hypothetical protein